MTPFTPLISLFVIGAVAAVVPGPTFLLVSQIAMSRSRKQALLAVAGVATSGVIWATAALVGLAALFATVPWSRLTVQVVGGCYLVYLGAQSWRSRPVSANSTIPLLSSAFMTGLMTDLLNPKCFVFFASIFALLIPPSSPLWLKLGAIGTVTFIGFTCYGAVAALFSVAAIRTSYLAFGRGIERLCGTVMLLFGVALLVGHP
jgi:threonine efflux protein